MTSAQPSGTPAWARFDPQLRSASPALRARLAAFAQGLLHEDTRNEKRMRARKADDERRFRLAVEALACNVLSLTLHGHGLPLSIPRSSAILKGGPARYRSPVYGEHVPRIVDVLVRRSLLMEVQKGHSVKGGPRQPSMYVPTEAFKALLFNAEPPRWSDLAHEEPHEVLWLKGSSTADDEDASGDDEKQRPLDYPETAETTRMRHEVLALNARLRDAPLSLVDTDAPGFTQVDPGKRSLRRIFNNGRWTEGGRLYDGFWQTMERPRRFRHLRIGGEPVANVDYGQLYLRLAYARNGLQAPLNEDLYAWPEMTLGRDHVKVLVNAMLFSRKPLQRIPVKLQGKIGRGKLVPARVAILSRHSAIADGFHCGLGHVLSCLESNLLLDVLARLALRTIDALPVHDSVLVALSRAEQAQGIMRQAFRDHFNGLDAPVDIRRSDTD